MLTRTDNPISDAIEAMKSSEPKSKSRQTDLRPYIEDLRKLKHQGYTNIEIVNTFKAFGVRVSHARLRQILNSPQSAQQRRHRQPAQDKLRQNSACSGKPYPAVSSMGQLPHIEIGDSASAPDFNFGSVSPGTVGLESR